MITGVNIPAAQLQVAMGIPLGGNPDIRRLYNRAPFSKDPIDFVNELKLPPKVRRRPAASDEPRSSAKTLSLPAKARPPP
jgi:acetyl-CoA carboxylase/biotin carboxylase 1